MLVWLRQLDKLIRGDATQISVLKSGKVEFPTKEVLIAAVTLAMSYGVCMGLYAVLRTSGALDGWMQMLASVVKLPLLFLLTLFVTLPSLYVFNAIVGSRLTFASVVNLLVATMAVTVTVLASLGPIVAFFSLSTTSHPFMVLLNVIAASIAGSLGMRFLFTTLNRLVFTRTEVKPEVAEFDIPPVEPSSQLAALDKSSIPASRDAKGVFQTWVVVFALVGAQMSWVLRPFVGSPSMEFAWFRERESNFFMAVFEILRGLLGG
jgi:hypothetical protein